MELGLDLDLDLDLDLEAEPLGIVPFPIEGRMRATRSHMYFLLHNASR